MNKSKKSFARTLLFYYFKLVYTKSESDVYHAESAFDRSDHPPESNLRHTCWPFKLKLKDVIFVHSKGRNLVRNRSLYSITFKLILEYRVNRS
jgi:hypothetical protein